MNKIIFAIVACTIASAAFATQEGSRPQSGTRSDSSSTAVSGARGGDQSQSATATNGSTTSGNSQGVVINMPAAPEQRELTRSIVEGSTSVEYTGSYTQTLKNVPSIGAPALTSSNDTCMGSTSVGGAGVGFGLTIGTTWKDENCLMLKNSRELWNMGMKAAAMARMCMDDKNREALELTGFVCPQTQKEAK